jgi:hypothetical protein
VKAGDQVMLVVSRGPDNVGNTTGDNNGNGNGNNGHGNGKGKGNGKPKGN